MTEFEPDTELLTSGPLKGYVMIVEQSPDTREMMRTTLLNAGYGAVAVENRDQAIEAIHSGNNPLLIELILINSDDPEAGRTVSYFREQFPSVALIGMTGATGPEGGLGARMKLVILGAGKGGSALLGLFSQLPGVEILGIGDRDPQAPALTRARELGIPVTDDLLRLIAHERVDLIVDVTGEPGMGRLIAEHKRSGTEVLGGAAAKLLWDLVQHEIRMHTRLSQTERLADLVRDGALADYLVKPVSEEGLIHSVAKALEKRTVHGS